MNLQQLEYIAAIDTHRHFAAAADSCNVTQPTLSMMVQKLEEELGIKIFDRSRQPVQPTPDGEEIIARAKTILAHVRQVREFALEHTQQTAGMLQLAVIPTLAPYILPFFLTGMVEKYPQLKITVREATTMRIIELLKKGEADIGLLSTPLNESSITEYPLFYEELLAYSTLGGETKKIKPGDIDLDNLWLLEEGHCFRAQVFNYCELRKKQPHEKRLQYEAGSIQTLINMLDLNPGITIIPQLATHTLSAEQKKKVHPFTAPQPVRQVSLVTHHSFSRKKLLEALKTEILENVPQEKPRQMQVLNIAP